MKKWLYERDFRSKDDLYRCADYWLTCGYRVFIQGHSAMECDEYPRTWQRGAFGVGKTSLIKAFADSLKA